MAIKLEVRTKDGNWIGTFKNSMAQKYLAIINDNPQWFECKRKTFIKKGNEETHLVYEVIEYAKLVIGEFELMFEPKDYIKVLP